MFKNLPTSTKLMLLCGTFLIAIVAAIYGLVAEKMIAIEFARKELVGTRYLETIRGAYAAILNEPEERYTAAAPGPLPILDALAEAQSRSSLDTSGPQRGLSEALRQLWAPRTDGGSDEGELLAALAAARELAARVGDNSNLTLDPDLDSYYLQDTIANKLPTLLGQLGEVQMLLSASAEFDLPVGDLRKVDFLLLDGLVRSSLEAVQSNLAAASKANHGSDLKRLDIPVAAMVASTTSYLATADVRVGGEGSIVEVAGLGNKFAETVDPILNAWQAIQAELERLLNLRIDGLADRLYRSLMLTGALALLSIAIALMTHRHIALPLARLEGVARTVRQTGDYSLRSDYQSSDEIGKLAGAFNEMLAELAAARGREAAEQTRIARLQAEVARVSRLTTMGEMAASIAHEINQPLAAIVANANAGLRWLGKAVPDFAEAQSVLRRIVSDGYRASQVIKSVRATFKAEANQRSALSVNELIEEALALCRNGLQAQGIAVRLDLGEGLPAVSADRVQIQQVLLNLINNAAEAMTSVNGRPRQLEVATGLHAEKGVQMKIADTGPGINAEHMDRIFEPFFTTKDSGMGLGLAICRSIVEAHGGRLSAAGRLPHGSVFSIVLPTEADAA